MKEFFKKNLPWIIPLGLIFGFGLYFRIYRLNDLLGFYYDSGRDALVIWEIIKNGKLTLIGPTTGIEGIFLGPFYYYLLVPGYLFGKGNPATAAALIATINALTVFPIFFAGKKLFNPLAGLIAALIFAFSWDGITFARWFANPSPLPFFASMIILSLVLLKQQKSEVWALILALSLAFSLQLEAASAIWFIPAIALSFLLFKIRVSLKWAGVSILSFLILSSFQIIFDLRHDFLITKAFYNFLIARESFRPSIIEITAQRVPFYINTYAHSLGVNTIYLLLSIAFSVLTFIFVVFKNKNEIGVNLWRIGILLIWIGSPLVGLIFYQGNENQVWSYYLSGSLPALFLILGFALSVWFTKVYLIPAAAIVIYFFLNQNLNITLGYLSQGFPEGETINFSNQKAAIDAIYKDANGAKFNADAYVPPVIPYTYDYLFLWYGHSKYGYLPEKESVRVLYTIEEADPPHPERLEAFIKRQNTLSYPVASQKLGGITVEKRIRY